MLTDWPLQVNAFAAYLVYFPGKNASSDLVSVCKRWWLSVSVTHVEITQNAATFSGSTHRGYDRLSYIIFIHLQIAMISYHFCKCFTPTYILEISCHLQKRLFGGRDNEIVRWRECTKGRDSPCGPP